MTNKELRIGNLVDLGNRIAKVIDIGHLSCTVVDLEETQDTLEDYERTQGIPLTEEWLEKFGFQKNITTDLYPTFSYNILNINDGIVYVLNYGFITHIKYLHQLQNLYFALTGEELILKES